MRAIFRNALVWPVLAATALSGCTLKQYVAQADRVAEDTLRQGQSRALGSRPPFDVTYRPLCPSEADDGGRVIRFDDKTIPLGDGDETTLTLNDCLQIAARNSREFQTRKETLYLAALEVANERRAWNWTLFGGETNADVTATRFGNDGGADSDTATADSSATLTRRFAQGGTLLLAASVDFATDFLGSGSTTVGSMLDANFTQPLLRGAWRDLAYEDQYRLERDFLFAVFDYQRFTQTFAVEILTAYYSVLQRRDALENEAQNIARLEDTVLVTTILVEGGHRSRIEADQAEQDLIDAKVRYERLLQTYEDALDAFKITLGLPIAARIRVDYPKALADLNEVGPLPIVFAEDEAIEIAMRTRPDVLTRRAELRDAERDVEIAADNFLPQLDLVLDINAEGTPNRKFAKVRFHDHSRTGQLVFNYPLDQTDNRDAYRAAIIDREQTRRDYEEFIDETVRLGVRGSYRSLLQSQRSYELQKQNVEIGEYRRAQAAREQKAGKASARDVLEAEEQLRNAQNGQTNALITYTTTRLGFLAALGMLDVDDHGLIHERAEPFGFERIAQRYPYTGQHGETVCNGTDTED